MNAPCLNTHIVSDFDPMPAEMAPPLQGTPLELAPVGNKAVEIDFAGGRLSSDAGVVLLKDIHDQLGLTRNLAAVLSDPRDPRRITFTLEDLITPRVLHIAAGYEDANDANTLRDDPIFTLMLDRLPETGAPLASQPTISRFENRISRTELYRLALVLLHQFIASYVTPPKVIVLDVDDTEDPVHGQQEQARYDG
jgi:Transposase DDE domain group 1